MGFSLKITEVKDAAGLERALSGINQRWFRTVDNKLPQIEKYAAEQYLSQSAFVVMRDGRDDAFLLHPRVGACNNKGQVVIAKNKATDTFQPGFSSGLVDPDIYKLMEGVLAGLESTGVMKLPTLKDTAPEEPSKSKRLKLRKNHALSMAF